jgi:tetratricopeptide (TPR) repeat protein
MLTINGEILGLCQIYTKPFQKCIQELKIQILQYGAFSKEVSDWLEDCPQFLVDPGFVATAYSLVGYQLFKEGAITTASDFLDKLIDNYPNVPLAYVTKGFILYKQGDLRRSLSIISLAKNFYAKQKNRFEELKIFNELEEALQQLIEQDTIWDRFHRNFAMFLRFFMLGQ